MIKRILATLIGILAIATTLQASEADQLIDNMAARLNDGRSLKASFTISGNNQHQQGTIVLQGQRFHAEAGAVSTWYDGTTQWTYLKQSKEVDITEPTPEELEQVNPFAIINTIKRNFTARMGKEGGKGKTLILTPKNPRGDYSKVVVTTQPSDSTLPAKIMLTLRKGPTITITMSQIQAGKGLPISSFRFNAKNYPGVEVVDLR